MKYNKSIGFLILLLSFTCSLLFARQAERQVHGYLSRFTKYDRQIKSIGDQLAETHLTKTFLQLSPARQNLLKEPMESPFNFSLLPGKDVVIRFNTHQTDFDFIVPPVPKNYPTEVEQALNKSPLWLRNDLCCVFNALDEQSSLRWARLINEVEGPYVDEVAFSIAHMSVEYLQSSYATEELFKLNAQLIYQYDSDLQYVQLVDYGEAGDDDYYTTARYRYVHYFDTLEIEIPREIYYYYVVHPQLSDEIPAFIDPSISEDNHSHKNNIVSPSKGYFWRDFLYNHPDVGYANLKKMLKQARTVITKRYHFDADGNIDAVAILSRWLDRSLQFTSDEERPHQPVRIYRKHQGRCGEYSDMRLAIGRIALIPTVAVASISTDHVWNEFFLQQWVHWDDTIDKPDQYEKGWGKKFGSVFQMRGDGFFTSVTDRYYSKISHITVHVSDSSGRPLDGAQVILYTKGIYSDLSFDNYGVTNNQGDVTFIVGAERDYHVRILTDYGNIPAGSEWNVYRIVRNATPGIHYLKKFQLPATLGQILAKPTVSEYPGQSQALLKVNLNANKQILTLPDIFDDLGGWPRKFVPTDSGQFSAWIVDQKNFEKYYAGQEFEYLAGLENTSLLNFEFSLPTSSNYYLILSNHSHLKTAQSLLGTLQLFKTKDSTIAQVQLLDAYPNPFIAGQQKSVFRFQLPEKTEMNIDIFNSLGQKVISLFSGVQWAGNQEVDWDGTDERGRAVASGVYFCRLSTSKNTVTCKVLVLK